MSVEKPEELQTTPAPQAAALTDAERAELEALRAEKERRELEALRAEKERAELEALRAEKTRAAQAEAAVQAEVDAAVESEAQQRAARQAVQQEAEQIRRIQEQRAKGRALMEPDEDDEDIKMPLGQKIVIGTVVILAVIFVVSQFIL
ncbi:MAG: hypothetical protein KHX99_03675 [Atopobium sp.]|nr:hypothetical protein [Atopobium sp.]